MSRHARTLALVALLVPAVAPAAVGCGAAPPPPPAKPAAKPEAAKTGPFARVALPKGSHVVFATFRQTYSQEDVEGRAEVRYGDAELVAIELRDPDASGYVAPPAPPKLAPLPPEPGQHELVRVHAIAFGPRMAPVVWDSHDDAGQSAPPQPRPPVEGPLAPATRGCESFAAIEAFVKDVPTITAEGSMDRVAFEAGAVPAAAALLELAATGNDTPSDVPLVDPPTCDGGQVAADALADGLSAIRAWALEDDPENPSARPVDPSALSFADPRARWIAVVRAFRDGRAAAPAIISALRAGDAPTKRAALLAAWGVNGPGELTDAVLGLVGDADPSVRAWAWYALDSLEPPTLAAFPTMLALLRSGDQPAREHVFELLETMGGAARPLAPKLAEIANDKDEAFALVALEALDRLRANAIDALPALRTTLESPSRDRRRAALVAISSLRAGGKDATPSIVARAKDADEAIRALACTTLADVGADAKAAVPVLVDALADKSEIVRVAGARALRRFARDAVPAVTKLVAALDDISGAVRGEAARTIGAIGPKAAIAVPALTKLLQRETGWWGQESALDGLGGIGAASRPALPAMRALLKSDVETVRRETVRAMVDVGAAAAPEIPAIVEAASKVSGSFASTTVERIGMKMGRAAAPALVKLLTSDSKDVRRGAVRGLGALGKDGGPEVPKLLERIDDEALRFDVFYALGAIGPAAAPAVPKLVELLAKQPAYRRDVLRTLSSIGAPAIAALARVAKDKARPADLRLSVGRAILDVGPAAAGSTLAVLEIVDELGSPAFVLPGFERVGKPAVAKLVEASRDKRPTIRLLAIQALGDVVADGKKEAILALLAAMKDPETSAAARRAIEWMGRSRAMPVLEQVLLDKTKADLHEYARPLVEAWRS